MTNKEQELADLVGRITGRLMAMPYLIEESNVGAHDALEALLVEIGIGVDEYLNSSKCAVSCGEIRFLCVKCGEFYR